MSPLVNILATNPVFSPPPRSRIPVFFPNFSRARVRTYAKYDQNWREAPKISGFSIPKVSKWLELGRNQGKLGRNLGNLGNKTLRMYIFPHSGEFFRGSGGLFFPTFQNSCFLPPRLWPDHLRVGHFQNFRSSENYRVFFRTRYESL